MALMVIPCGSPILRNTHSDCILDGYEAIVDTSVSDADLKRMHEQGARGIRFNLAQAGHDARDDRAAVEADQ
jgi:hypothetical protein